MPTSDITSMAMRDEWFVGDVRTYQSDVTTSSGPFTYSITLDPVIPHIEKVNFYAKPTAVDGTDQDGIYYGGVYKPDTSNIQVTGSGLTSSQRQIIRSSLGYNISSQTGGEDRFSLNINPVAAAGAQFFSIVVPYKETLIVNSSPLIDIPFFTITGDSTAADPTTVIIDQTNDKVIIDAGDGASDFPALRIKNIANGRTFISATSEKSDGDFTVSWNEDISNRPMLVVDNDFGIQPVQIGSYRYAMDYRYRAQISGSNLTLSVGRQACKSLIGSSSVASIDDFLSISVGRGVNGTATVTGHSTLNIAFTSASYGANTTTNILRIRNLNAYGAATITFEFTNSYIRASSVGQIAGGGVGPVSYTRAVSSSTTVKEAIDRILLLCDDLSSHLIFTEVSIANYAIFANSYWGNVGFTTLTVPYLSGLGYSDYLTYIAPGTASNSANFDLTTHTVSSLADAIGAAFPYIPWLVSITSDALSSWEGMPAMILSNGSYSFGGSTSIDEPLPISHVSAGGEFFSDSIVYDVASSPTFTHLASLIGVDFSDEEVIASAGLYYSALAPASYLPTSYDSGTIHSIFDTPSFLSINSGTANWSSSYSVTLDGTVTVSNLISSLNTYLSGMFVTQLLDSQYANFDANELNDKGPDSLVDYGSQSIYGIGSIIRIMQEYPFGAFPTLSSLIDAINSYWNTYGVTAEIHSQTQNYPTESITSNLKDNTSTGGVNVFDTTEYFAGTVHSFSTPAAPTENVTYSFNVRFASGGNQNDLAGIQIALGGYDSGGVFFPNDSPNSFFEPGYNTLFPVEFNVLNADTVYLLVRSRQNLEGTLFTSEEADYAGVARFNNGFPSQTLLPSIPTDPKFTDVWTENNLGEPPLDQVPVVLAVTGASSVINVLIDDIQIPDSIHVLINNPPEVLDNFAFLAINRSNLNGSMTESKDGRVFGMVLDNRGIWDVLIGPEAEIAKAVAGDFNHLGMSYQRTTLDDDEAYDFEFSNASSLPSEVRSAVSLIPVPGYPQVWILRIERGVKEYLASLRDGISRNSQDGCSIDIDMLVTGRTSEVEGVCRVTIFYDVYCVFDVQLCDTFWNLTNPNEPGGPPLIEDQLLFNYQSLIDCQKLEMDTNGANTDLSVPILLNIRNVPMFENGNALLLIKSFYTSEIQGFYFPVGEDLSDIVFEDCSTVGSNLPLFSTLNRPLLYLPGQTTPITDPIEIAAKIQSENSYLYVKPAFQFPSTDSKKDCGQDEVVITAFGYQFKNWISGLREDNILFGVDMVIPGGVYVSPELQLCYRYYYDQEES